MFCQPGELLRRLKKTGSCPVRPATDRFSGAGSKVAVSVRSFERRSFCVGQFPTDFRLISEVLFAFASVDVSVLLDQGVKRLYERPHSRYWKVTAVVEL